MTSHAKLGPVLHSLRKRNDWTLSDVAKRTGLSVSTLSKAERGQQALTYDKIVQLVDGLQIDISTLFEGIHEGVAEVSATGRRSVSHADDGTVVDTDNYQYVYLCTDLLKKKFVPIIAEIRARSLEEFGKLIHHAGEEFSYVLEGTVEVHTEHYAPTLLKAGDSMYFDSHMGHAYIAHGPERCRVLSICSGPEAALQETITQHFGPAKSTKPRKNRKS